jgi:hypothetical protein
VPAALDDGRCSAGRDRGGRAVAGLDHKTVGVRCVVGRFEFARPRRGASISPQCRPSRRPGDDARLARSCAHLGEDGCRRDAGGIRPAAATGAMMASGSSHRLRPGAVAGRHRRGARAPRPPRLGVAVGRDRSRALRFVPDEVRAGRAGQLDAAEAL